MATTITCSLGSRSADNVTVNSVSGSTPGPYTVTLSASVPSTTKIGDTLTDSSANKFLIEGISGSDLTVNKRHFGSASDPATGAGTTQRAYSSAKAWGDAAPASLVTADQVWRGECWNDATFLVDGGGGNGCDMDSTCDATRYMILTTGAGQSFVDQGASINHLRPDQANGVLFQYSSVNPFMFNITGNGGGGCIIENVQIVDTRTNNAYTMKLDSATGAYGYMRNCIVKSSTNWGTLQVRKAHVYNNVFLKPVASGRAIEVNGSTGDTAHNTCINTSGASTSQAIAASVTKSNATFGWGADNTITAGSGYNATDRASFGANSSNDQVSLTIADEVEGATSGSEDARAKSTGHLANNGTQVAVTGDLDIVGQSRSATTPTIGAWELPSGAFPLGPESIALTGIATVVGDLGMATPDRSWVVPSNAPESTTGYMIVFSGSSGAQSIVDQGAVEADASGNFALSCGDQGTALGTKAFAVVHAWDDDTDTVSIYGGPGIGTVTAD